MAVALGAVLALAGPAGAACADEPYVPVIQASGRLDPVLVDYLTDEIDTANEDCAAWVVLHINSSGAAGNEGGLADLVETIEASEVPVAVWVGQSGARATNQAVDLLAVADRTGLAAPNSNVEVTPELLAARDIELADLGTNNIGDRVKAERALELGLVDDDSAALGDFLLSLPDVESEPTEDGEGRQIITEVQFHKLPLLGQLMHTVGSPSVAYLLFVIGLALLVFELYTAGVGIAGMVGAGCVALGSYGLTSLPTRPLGVALLLFAIFGYAIDVQTGVPRAWSVIATVSFAFGSIVIFDGVSISWITLIVALVGLPLAMVSGMPTMVRSRFSTPTIGREWMIGELGLARTRIAPDGVVVVRDAPWRARTNRATPIERDETIRVVSIEGLVLEVEPEEGGARDYRERSKDRPAHS